VETILDWYSVGRSWLGVEHYPTRDAGSCAALVVHGFRAWHRWGFFPIVARSLVERGIAAFVVALPSSGYGPDGFSGERFARATVSDDLAALAKAAEIVRCRCTCLAGLGHSRGALLLALVCTELDCLAMWSPPRRFGRWSERQLIVWRSLGAAPAGTHPETGQPLAIGIEYLDDLERNDYNARLDAALAGCRTPTCIVAGEHDIVAPPSHAAELHALLGTTDRHLHIVSGTGHTFGVEHGTPAVSPALAEAIETTASFFHRCCRPSGNFATPSNEPRP
jgi:pimeloyl-ACP methyl ester carboxylesterase